MKKIIIISIVALLVGIQGVSSQVLPSVSVLKCDVANDNTLCFQLVNESELIITKATFTLTDAKGKAYGSVRVDSLYPRKHFNVAYPLQGKNIYSLFVPGLPKVSYKSKAVNGSFDVPAEMQLLAIARGAKNEPELAALGEKLDATIAIYNCVKFEGHPVRELINKKYTTVNDPYTDLAAKAVRVMAEGDESEKTNELKKIIAEITDKQKDYSDKSIYLISHSHQDLYWLWGHQESVKMMKDNLRQAVAFLKEFPQYRFSQSQTAIYSEIEKYDPKVFEEIKGFVQDGRFELIGGQRSEGDNNLSSGEATIRSFLIGQRYFQSHFGKMAKVGWLPDNFGHIGQLPQLLNSAGINSFYLNRCNPYSGCFVWEGVDGSKVLAYANPSYVTNLHTNICTDFEKLIPEQDRLFHVLGVGDHGGGPTRLDISTERLMQKIDKFPSIEFTSAENFFSEAYKDVDKYPVHKGEMQFIFEGCYTSVSGIKEGNRNSEARMFESEILNSINHIYFNKYPVNELNNAWEKLTFNQFHDILPGSSIFEANKDALSTYNQVERAAVETKETAFRSIADHIKLKKDKGQPVVAFNFQPYKGKTLVEAEVFTYDKAFSAELSHWMNYYDYNKITPVDRGQGNFPTVHVTDNEGNIYPAQIVGGKLFPPGFRMNVLFVVDKMPPGGYKSFYVDVSNPGKRAEGISYKDGVFETDYFIIKINSESGRIISLIDKRSGKEYANGELNTLNIYQEDMRGSMKAWSISKINSVETMKTDEVKIIEAGPVRACIESRRSWGNSHVIERCYIYKSYPRIDYNLEVHWLEAGSGTKDSPMLRTNFPLNMDTSKLRFSNHVPFAVLDRPINGQEVPAQRWVDVTDGTTGIALLNKTKYGHSLKNDTLRLTLLRSSAEPDYYPNWGRILIDYALYPHTGDWTNSVWREGDLFNNPVYASEPASLSAKPTETLPEEASLYEISTPDVVLTGMKKAEDSDMLVIRLCEVAGKETEVTVRLPGKIKHAERMDILERTLKDVSSPSVDGNTLKVKIKAHEIITLGCAFDSNELFFAY